MNEDFPFDEYNPRNPNERKRYAEEKIIEDAKAELATVCFFCKNGICLALVNLCAGDKTDPRPAPDYYLVLAWNFLDFFRGKYADYLASGGKFVIPHPTVEILEN